MPGRKLFIVALLAGWWLGCSASSAVYGIEAKASSGDPTQHDAAYDVVIYGGTAAGVVAAIQADAMGLRTALVSPDRHLGGMTSGGLGWTDSKNGAAIGGLARQFFHRVWQYYQQPETWSRSERADYAWRMIAQPGRAVDDEREVMWTFEPHAAEAVFDRWLAESGVDVFRDEWLDREAGVSVRDGRIETIRTLSGRTFAGRMFIDATYEGDLMAAAGVSHRIGRDAASEFNERLNGIRFEQPGARYFKDDAFVGIDPYVNPGEAGSGFIVGVEGELPAEERFGERDSRLQSFNYRLCLTTEPDNRIPIERPTDYHEADYELLLRLYEAGHRSGFTTHELPNRKTDSNSLGVMSFDFVGGNQSIVQDWNYTEASYEVRRRIAAAHRDYQLGLLWTIMNHPRVPEEERRKWSRYGLTADEFRDTENWPHQLYVREARRLQGLATMTQHHVQMKPGFEVTDSIGLGSYSLDSHDVRRLVIDGQIRSEGGFYEYWDKPYPIAYGSIVPRRGEVQNLLVPVTLSATHAAFGSIRMEPTYMILGQSAATAAGLAISEGLAVQEVPYALLRERLATDGQMLEFSATREEPADARGRFETWGAETLAAIHRDLWMAERGLYAERRIRDGEQLEPAFTWGVGVQLSALTAATRVDPATYQGELTAYIDAVEPYWVEHNGVGGYDVLPVRTAVDRYYDDNAWLVLALVEAHRLTGEEKYLLRAAQTQRFVLSGEDESLGGGIYWRENVRESKNTCGNAPAIVGALLLYQETEDADHLAAAKRLYEWTRSQLQDEGDGLYWDNVRIDGRVDRRKYTYNSAVMLRANVLLYEITGEAKYRDKAKRMAESAAQHWIDPDSGAVRDSGRFAHMLLEALLEVDRVTDENRWLPTVEKSLEYVHEHIRDRDGRYGSRWDRQPRRRQRSHQLLDQAGVARAYFAAAHAVRLRAEAAKATNAVEQNKAAAPASGTAAPP